jgi:hypothetical protein
MLFVMHRVFGCKHTNLEMYQFSLRQVSYVGTSTKGRKKFRLGGVGI